MIKLEISFRFASPLAFHYLYPILTHTYRKQMKYGRLLFLGGGLLTAVSPALAQKSDKPNIIFILCDDMGYGDLGCYGQRYIDTPNLDRMASEGMRFTQAYSGSPVSAPSRASIMTGQHSGHGEVRGNKEYWPESGEVRYGINTDYAVVGQHPYDPDHVILTEVMKDNGYTTGMFGKWAGGYEGSVSTPDKRGVDEFFGYICQFQAHLYYPNFLNRYNPALGDTATVRVTLDENIRYPMWGAGYGHCASSTRPTSFTGRRSIGSTASRPTNPSSATSPTPCRTPSWCSPRTPSCSTNTASGWATRVTIQRQLLEPLQPGDPHACPVCRHDRAARPVCGRGVGQAQSQGLGREYDGHLLVGQRPARGGWVPTLPSSAATAS